MVEVCFNGEDFGFVYLWYVNLMVVMFEDWIKMLEGVEVVCVIVSGMVVVNFVLMVLVKVGDYVIVVKVLFGFCCYICEILLLWFGVESMLVDGIDIV